MQHSSRPLAVEHQCVDRAVSREEGAGDGRVEVRYVAEGDPPIEYDFGASEEPADGAWTRRGAAGSQDTFAMFTGGRAVAENLRLDEIIEGADYVEGADLVIKALGFEPEDLPKLWGVDGLEVTRWGTIKAAFTTGKTSLDGVFAVGDIVRGASLVVWAINEGRGAARECDRFLMGSTTLP